MKNNENLPSNTEFQNFIVPGEEAARIEELHRMMSKVSPYVGEAALADVDVSGGE